MAHLPQSNEEDSPGQITELLIQWRAGDDSAFDRLIPLINPKLRRIAAMRLNHERAGHTLQPDDVAQLACLRLRDQTKRNWKNRYQFYALSDRIMQFILIDHARARDTAKRGGKRVKVSLDDTGQAHLLEQAGRPATRRPDLADCLAVREAFEKLRRLDPRLAAVLEMRAVLGMTVPEIARDVGRQPATVNRYVRLAVTFLRVELGIEPAEPTK